MTHVPEASHGLQNPLEHSVPPYSQSNRRGAVSAGSGNQYPCPCGFYLLVPMVARRCSQPSHSSLPFLLAGGLAPRPLIIPLRSLLKASLNFWHVVHGCWLTYSLSILSRI